MRDICKPIDPDRLKPFVHEDGRMLSLHFEISSIQSRMCRDDPVALQLDYTQAMMGFLLFAPGPARLLMLGLGGGSLAKYCRAHLPTTDITVVEINPHVIALRGTFAVPNDSARFRVVCNDGAAFVARKRRPFDVILVDGFTCDGQSGKLCTPAFYSDCRASLASGGVLAVNLHDEGDGCELLADRIAAAFDGKALAVRASDGSNRVVFATDGPSMQRFDGEFSRRWAGLPEVHRRTLRSAATRLRHGLLWPPLDSTDQALDSASR
jgi:spermidine synthase